MELADMIRQAEADLKTADADVDVTHADVDRAQAAHAAAKQHQTNMRAILIWLRQKAEQAREMEVVRGPELKRLPEAEVKRLPEAEPVLVEERFGRPVSAVSQTDLCLLALERLGRPSTTAEIREYLAREGFSYDQSQIRGALKYLSKKKHAPVETPRTGTWRLTRPNTPDPALNGTNISP